MYDDPNSKPLVARAESGKGLPSQTALQKFFKTKTSIRTFGA